MTHLERLVQAGMVTIVPTPEGYRVQYPTTSSGPYPTRPTLGEAITEAWRRKAAEDEAERVGRGCLHWSSR